MCNGISTLSREKKSLSLKKNLPVEEKRNSTFSLSQKKRNSHEKIKLKTLKKRKLTPWKEKWNSTPLKRKFNGFQEKKINSLSPSLHRNWTRSREEKHNPLKKNDRKSFKRSKTSLKQKKPQLCQRETKYELSWEKKTQLSHGDKSSLWHEKKNAKTLNWKNPKLLRRETTQTLKTKKNNDATKKENTTPSLCQKRKKLNSQCKRKKQPLYGKNYCLKKSNNLNSLTRKNNSLTRKTPTISSERTNPTLPRENLTPSLKKLKKTQLSRRKKSNKRALYEQKKLNSIDREKRTLSQRKKEKTQLSLKRKLISFKRTKHSTLWRKCWSFLKKDRNWLKKKEEEKNSNDVA